MTAQEIPFQPQTPDVANRRCGAAALAMVYASFGMAVRQEEIWQAIAEPNRQGVRTARTYRLARHAQERGLAALVFQAAEPWAVLLRCWEHQIRVILNHRLRSDSRLGHFSVLAGIEAEEALLHDPQFGPARRLTRAELLRLWLPTAGGCEIAGQVLVAIARPGVTAPACHHCRASSTVVYVCPTCGTCGELAPIAALGCANAACPRRHWKHVFCPQCDSCLSATLAGLLPPSEGTLG